MTRDPKNSNRTCNICGAARFVDMKPNAKTRFTRKNVQCDTCLSLERHRLVFEVLQQSGRLSKPQNILHFAPEVCLGKRFAEIFGSDYHACDIEPEIYHGLHVDRVDLCKDLGAFREESYDIVIHNHVLEHLHCNFRDVLRTLDRLLKAGGIHVFSLPFMLSGYRESLSGLSEHQRVDLFGQHDHVRVFSPDDFASVISSVFEPPPPYDATRLIAPERLRQIGIPEYQWHGFNNNSVFILEKKSPSHPSRWVTEPISATVKRKKLNRKHVQAETVLFITGDGPAKGHLVRSIAIAEQLRSAKPVFLTMSEDVDLLIERGHQAHFVPHHNATGEDPVRWHGYLEQEIRSIASLSNVKALVYDLNFIFDGVIEVLRRAGIPSVWIRRAMWPELHAPFIGAGVHFSKILEPAELAGSLDDGPTKKDEGRVTRIPPVLLTLPDRRLSRAEARETLGIDPDAAVIAVDLGGSKNERFGPTRNKVLELLTEWPEIDVFELRNDDLTNTISLPSTEGKCARVPFHAYLYSAAWDAFVGRPGYNTFHEIIFGGLPALFVADTSPDMDRQDLRARWAQSNDCALSVALDATDEDYRAALTQLALQHRRHAISSNCIEYVREAGISPDGAQRAAQFIEQDLLGYTEVCEPE